MRLLLCRERLISGGRTAWLGHTALWQPRAKRRPTERERRQGSGDREEMKEWEGEQKDRIRKLRCQTIYKIAKKKKTNFILCLGN